MGIARGDSREALQAQLSFSTRGVSEHIPRPPLLVSPPTLCWCPSSTHSPSNKSGMVTMRSEAVCGTMSPYPTVVRVVEDQ